VIAVALLAPWLVWAVVRVFALEGHLERHAYAVIAFTPWAGLTALLPLVVALALRRWVVAAAAAVVVAAFAAVLLPRALGGPRPSIDDPVALRIATINVRKGAADPAAVVAMVRRSGVSILSVVELTPEEVARLDRAGLRRLLPHRLLDDAPDAGGTGLYAREPLHRLPAHPALRNHNGAPRGRLRVPGGPVLDVQALHAPPPQHGSLPVWKSILGGLPLPSGGRPLPILIGDFNATLDHAALRRLVGDGGYVDAADAAGQGLRMTYPADRSFPALIAIDHVLVDPRIAVRRLDVVDIAGTDHRGLVAALELPRSTG
jgi:endonuclease/exonuclease/phosphatase (EEP) superfamily protein YafD